MTTGTLIGLISKPVTTSTCFPVGMFLMRKVPFSSVYMPIDNPSILTLTVTCGSLLLLIMRPLAIPSPSAYTFAQTEGNNMINNRTHRVILMLFLFIYDLYYFGRKVSWFGKGGQSLFVGILVRKGECAYLLLCREIPNGLIDR